MKTQPPRWVQRLLEYFCDERLFEEIEGDLQERFQRRLNLQGEQQARRKYIKEALGFVRSFAFKRKSKTSSSTHLFSTDMIRNYFKIAWRNLVNHKVYSAINIFGLTSGLVVGILILLWVQNELGFDRFHRGYQHTYRVLTNIGKGEDRRIWANSHAPIATYAKAEIPEIENAVRIC